jgi:hypothetical protein
MTSKPPPRWYQWLLVFSGWIVFVSGWIARGPWWSYVLVVAGGLAGVGGLTWRLYEKERATGSL